MPDSVGPKFAGRGSVHLRDISDRNKRVKQMLWGDWLNIVEDSGNGFFKIRWGSEFYWVRTQDCQDERPLEVVFVDVGQGDGCLLVTPDVPPDEKIMIIDAGQYSNMFSFVKWRFGKLKFKFNFHAAIATHPDQDHYKGFQPIFDQPQFSFDRLYHNGIAERTGADRLGPSDADRRYLIDLVETDAEARTLYGNPEARGRMAYPRLIHTALSQGRVGQTEMLSTAHGVQEAGRAWLPGFAPSNGSGLTIEIVGPVTEPDAEGRPRLRWFGDKIGSRGRDEGKTKNGHSVLLRLTYRNFTLLFGGDLNRPAEDFLLRHYAALAPDQPLSAGIAAASQRLRCDVMKCCHHGSADVTDEFLRAVDPFAFVVSSGDSESHVHPRPELLGRLGRTGRGEAPLLLCTELQRSTREDEDQSKLARLQALDALIEKPETPDAERVTLRAERAALQRQAFRRNVEVYGAITLRTDGNHLVLAFRLERDRGGVSPKRWQTYWFQHQDGTGFVPVTD